MRAIIFITVTAAVALASAAEYPGTQRQHVRSDADLQIAVLRGIVANPSVFVTDIRVEVAHGVVVLRGTVRSGKAREAAVAVAKSVPGVREVKDELRLDRP